MKKIKINIELPKASVIQRDLNNLIKQIDKNTSIKLDLDTNNFNKSLGEITQSIARLKTHVSSISGLDKIFEASAINSSTQAIEKRNQAIKEQQRIIESELSKTSNVKLVNADGTETIIKDLRTIKDEYGNIIETVNKYNSKTGELTSTIVKTTNEIEKQRIANEKALKERQKIEQDYENWWLKSLKNREIKEEQLYQKNLSSINTLKGQMQLKLNESLRNQNFTLVDDKVFTSLQNRIDSINTDTSIREINELKIALNNLGSSDSQIVRLQNAITKQEISISSLKEMYKDLIPKDELKKAEDSLNSLKNILDEIQSGKSYNNLEIRYNLDQASASMKNVTSSTKNAVEQQKLLNEETVTFGSALKELATGAGVFNIVSAGIDKIKGAFREGIENVIEMDTALANMNKVIDITDSQLLDMRDSALELGKAMGRNGIDVANAMSEFGRAYKDIEEIKQLTESAILGSNVMDGTSTEQVAQGLTTILSAMNLEADKSVTIIDSLNEVQNSYRVSASDMLNGLSEVASVANTAGASLQDLEGYLTAIIESTGQSGSEVGTSLNAIISRVYGVGREALEEMGIAVTDLEGEFRDIGDIFDDFYKKWQTLSKTEQISLAQEVGGTNRFNELVSLMNNYQTAIDATATAMDSLGSASKENEIYLQSIEGRITTLKTASQEFWINLINSDLIKIGVSTLQLLVNGLNGLQNTFGSLGLSVGALSTAFLMFTDNPLKKFSERVTSSKDLYKNLKEELDKSIATIKKTATETYGLNTSMSVAQKGGVLLKLGFKELGVAIDVTKIKAIALQAVLSGGISLAISAVIGVISSFASSMFNANESIEKVKQSAKDLGDALSSVNNSKADLSSYEEIKKKLEDTNLSEKERKELNDQLVDVKEKLYTIDDEAYAILNNQNLTYEEQLGLLKALNDEKLKEKGKELDKALGNGFWKQDEEKNAKLAAESLERQVKIYKEAEELFKNANGDFIQLSNGATIAVKDQVKYMESLRESMVKNSNTVQTYNSNVEAIKQTNTDTNRSTVELSGSIKSFVGDLIDATKAIDENTKAKEKNSNVDGVGTSTVDNTKKYSEAVSKTKEVYDLIQAINKAQAMTPDLINKIVQAYPEIGYKVNDVASAQEFLQEKIKETADVQAEAYNQMLLLDENYYNDKIKTNQALQDDFTRVINSFVKSNEEGYEVDWENYATLNDVKKDLTNRFGEVAGELISNLILANSQGYDVDIDNTVTWATEKARILEQLSAQIEKVKNQLANNLSKISSSATEIGGLEAEKLAMKAQKELDKLNTKQEEILTEFYKKNEGYKQYVANIGKSSVDMPSFGSGSGKGSGNSGNKGSSASKKEIADLELKRKRYFELETALEKVNNELKKNKSLQGTIPENEYLEKEIKLLKQKLDLNKKIRAEEIKESKELKNKISSWFTFDSNGFINNYNSAITKIESWANSADKEKRKKQAEAIVANAERYMAIINKEIPELDRNILDTSKAINEALTRQTEVKIDAINKNIDKIVSEIDKKLDNVNFKKKHFASYSYSDNIKFNKEELDLSKTKLQQLITEYQKLSKVTYSTKEGKEALEKALGELNKKIQDEKLNVLELTQSLEKLWLNYYESQFNSKKWQKETQQMNKIELELQVVGDDDIAKKIQLMNEKLKLQQSLVSDTEKYLKDLRNVNITTAESYGELVKKLMSAEEELYNQQSAVNSLKDAMNNLLKDTMTKYINQLKEIEELELKVNQERDKRALDEEYFKVSETDFKKYKDERLAGINEEISLLKNKLAVEGNNSALLDLLKAKQKELLLLSKQEYSSVNDWYSLQQDMHKFNISQIEKELEALNEKNKLEEENAQRLEKQNELIELQTQLTNIKNNKNIRELKKNADGSWGFDYTYDKEEYANTEKQYKDKQEELAKWEKKLEEDKYKEKLELQKKYEQEALNSLKELYDKQKEVLDKLHGEQNKEIEDKYKGMFENLDKYLQEITTKFGGDIPKIIEILKVELDKGKAVLKDFNNSLSTLFDDSTLNDKQKENFINLFKDRYTEVIKGTEQFIGKQKEIRKTANVNELIELVNHSKAVNSNTTTNLKALGDIYKTGWDNIMNGVQTVLAEGTKVVNAFENSMISSANSAIAQMDKIKSAYREMQSIISSVNSMVMPDVSAKSPDRKSRSSTTEIRVANVNFPNARSSSEIEKALENIETHALQYAKSKR